MKVVAVLHKYPTGHGAGAEWMAHEILKRLAEHGHDIQVVCRDDSGNEEFEGIPIRNNVRQQLVSRYVTEADVVFTHLDVTRTAIAYARHSKTPIVHMIHNHRQVRMYNLKPRTASLLVFNSNYIAGFTPQWPADRMIVAPPHVPVDRYRVTEGTFDHYTLLNLTEAKGAPIFYEMARRFPDKQFLGVKGAYGHQIVEDLPNVTIIENSPDVRRDVYSRTKVLLVPSNYETWGRVAVEAACSGIPVVASPTPGLKESMADAAIFAEWNRPDQWEAAIRRLDDPQTFDDWSDAGAKRARVLEGVTSAKLDELHDMVRKLA